MKSFSTASLGSFWTSRRRVPPTPTSPIHIKSGERVVWAGTGHPRPALLIAQVVGTAALGLFGGLSRRWEYVSVAGVMLCVWFLIVRTCVTVGPFGMRASLGLFGIPRVRIPIDQIIQVSIIDVKPSRWGGWGYRGSLRAFKRAAMIVRAGEGIRVELTNGRLFVVSVDDAATGVAVLQGAIEAAVAPMTLP